MTSEHARERPLMGFYVSESESHLTYMIDITLTVEVVLNDGVRWWERTRSSDGRLRTS